MNEPKTPNLGLNKIDRSSPSTTYFDLDKYLDQNWEKVDEGVGQVEEKAEESAAQVSSIQERLDTEQRKSVTLEQGLQIINAERTSAFKLEGLKGRTLVNLLGRDGGFYNLNHWSYWSASPPNVHDNKVTVIGTGSNLNPQITYTNLGIAPKVGEKLFLRAKATPKNVCSAVRLYLYSSGEKIIFNAMTTVNPAVGEKLELYGIITVTQQIVDNWSSIGFILVTEYSTTTNATNAVTEYAQAAMYKISIVDQSLTPQQVAAKYPYVDSVQPVRNPYVIRYGENLIPPFYEWSNAIIGVAKNIIVGAYELYQDSKDGSNYATSMVKIPVIPGKTYTLSGEVIKNPNSAVDAVFFYWLGMDGERLPGEGATTRKFRGTYIVPTNAVQIQLYCVMDVNNDSVAYKNQTIKNLMLTLGNTAKPFKPREDSMLALQTDLHANPDTGTNPDIVLERDGQYFKLAKWKRVILDGTFTHSSFGSGTGFKVVNAMLPGPPAVDGSGVLTKYQGKLIKETDYATVSSQADNLNVGSSGGNGIFDNFQISIANSDSGWGDSYTDLTTDEIKAYFMGWKMYDVNTNPDGSGVYNRTDGTAKWFVPIDRSSGGVNTLPTTKVTSVTPYQLLYQLATPIVEPITSEGQLTLNGASNQLEVGTGIVLREGVKPVRYGDWAVVNYTYDGNHALLKNKANVIMSVYKEGEEISNYLITRRHEVSYGNEYIGIPSSSFDPSAAYSVTYLMLDTSPVTPFVGSVANSEKALLTDLVQNVQQASARLSVVESKKAEKDAPAWITPTLLNGWVSFSPSFRTAQFYKDSNGVVHLRGFIKSGIANTLLFNLPTGYRPGAVCAMPVVSASDATGAGLSSGTINIQPYGQVQTAVNIKNGFLTLEGISFLAEQ